MSSSSRRQQQQQKMEGEFSPPVELIKLLPILIEPLLSLSYTSSRLEKLELLPDLKHISSIPSNPSRRPGRHRRWQQKVKFFLNFSFFSLNLWVKLLQHEWCDSCELCVSSGMGEIIRAICKNCDIWWNYCCKMVKFLKCLWNLWYKAIYGTGRVWPLNPQVEYGSTLFDPWIHGSGTGQGW